MIKLWASLLFYIVVAGCSSSPSAPASLAENKNEVSVPIDACNVLDKAIVEKVLGGPVTEGKSVLSDPGTAKTPAISQCTFYTVSTDKSKYIGILIQRDPRKNTNPKSREEYMEKMSVGNMMNIEEDVKKEMLKGTQVQGLGDLAFSWNYITQNLIVFWKGNYSTIISIYGREGEAGVLEDAKMIAGKIIEKFK